MGLPTQAGVPQHYRHSGRRRASPSPVTLTCDLTLPPLQTRFVIPAAFIKQMHPNFQASSFQLSILRRCLPSTFPGCSLCAWAHPQSLILCPAWAKRTNSCDYPNFCVVPAGASCKRSEPRQEPQRAARYEGHSASHIGSTAGASCQQLASSWSTCSTSHARHTTDHEAVLPSHNPLCV